MPGVDPLGALCPRGCTLKLAAMRMAVLATQMGGGGGGGAVESPLTAVDHAADGARDGG